MVATIVQDIATYAGILTGEIITTAESLRLVCESDQVVFPISVTGNRLKPPLPTGLQRWFVLPKTDSNGNISAFKTWCCEPIDEAEKSEGEVWEFCGRVRQVSVREGLVTLAIAIDTPSPQKATVVLKTSAIDQFKSSQKWQIKAKRVQGFLVMTAATRLDPEAMIRLTEDDLIDGGLVESIPTLLTADILIEASESDKPRTLDPDLNEVIIPKALAELESVTKLNGWKLGQPKSRHDSHWGQKIFEFNALWEGKDVHGQPVAHHARVKVSASGKSAAVYRFPKAKPKQDEVNQGRLTVTPLGAARDIGASCFRVLIGPYEVVLDTGTRPKGHNPLPAFEHLENPDLLLVTHAHQDHIGALPVFHSLFSGTPMFCSPGTREIAQVMLRDGLKVMQRNEDSEELFDEAELERSLFRLQTQPIGQEFEPLPGLKVRFIHAGHIVGAACVHLQYGERSLLYTGDYHVASSRTTDGLKIEDLPKAEILITESTYGDSLHPSRKKQERELIESVIEVVKGGGTVLIPAFALGRAQELILAFRLHADFRQLGIPIYIDGLVRAVTECFRNHIELMPVELQRFAETQEPFFSTGQPQIIPIEKTTDRPLAMAKPSVIIASSGMLNGGASVYYAKVLLERENAALFISGYTDEESPGRRVQSLKTGDVIEMDGSPVTVRAQIKRFGLSAHADRAGIGQVIERVSPQTLILIHGSMDTLHELAKSSNLRDKYKIFIPKVGDEIAYDAVPEQISPKKLAELELPTEFEIPLEAEVEGGWLRVPESVMENDPRWKELTETGMLKAKWMGNKLVLTRLKNPAARSRAAKTYQECCANCRYLEVDTCLGADSPLWGVLVDPNGKCEAFTAMEQMDGAGIGFDEAADVEESEI